MVQFFYDHDKNCNETATHFKVDRKQVGTLFVKSPTFIILFVLLFQILCIHSISCFLLIFSYWISVIAIFLPITVTLYHFGLFRLKLGFDKLRKYRHSKRIPDQGDEDVKQCRHQGKPVKRWSWLRDYEGIGLYHMGKSY